MAAAQHNPKWHSKVTAKRATLCLRRDGLRATLVVAKELVCVCCVCCVCVVCVCVVCVLCVVCVCCVCAVCVVCVVCVLCGV